MTSRSISALFVDDEAALREQYIENLTIALRDACDVEVIWETADRVEEAKKVLPRGQGKFKVVVVDLLWDAIGRPGGRDSRGLEVVQQAAKTPGVVIVAVSVGDTTNFPELPEQAKDAGAHLFRIRGALQATARSGGWDRLADDICEALNTLEGQRAKAGPVRATDMPETTKRSLFVVYGRNGRVTTALFDLLRSLGLNPYEWEQLVALAIEARRGGGNPNVFDVVEYGFSISHGAVVLFTPDDEARLRADLLVDSDPAFEAQLMLQPRPNVLLEAGYALRHDRDHTLIVSVGSIRPVSDLGGMHLLHVDNSAKRRKAFAERLRAMGFDVETRGDDWLRAGDFAS